jgi:lipopolysaccharide export system protein LptA
LRNAQAARYARWAGLVAMLLAAVVGGVFLARQIRVNRQQKDAPPVVPPTVERQSNLFQFSKVEQDHTIFTVRAGHATEYKDQNRAVLDDVWITIYGRDGSRNDNIHTRECSYQPLSGDVRCEGDVVIDLESAKQSSGTQSKAPAGTANASAKSAGGMPPVGALQVKTRDLSFSQSTGIAQTSEPVSFTFPQGTGHGIGLQYSSSDATVRVEKNVEFDLSPTEKTGGLPVQATGSSLEVNRNDHTVILNGPAAVHEGGRELTASEITVWLDDQFHAQKAAAEGHPAIHVADEKGTMDLTADRFEALLNAAGWVQEIAAEGKVAGVRELAPRSGSNAEKTTDRFNAARVLVAMQPEHNALREMTASGGVTGDSVQGADSRKIKTDALRVVFAPEAKAGDGPEKQRIESAETLAPATIESKASGDATELRAKKFQVEFGADGRLTKLLGHSGVEVTSQTAGKAPQVTSAAELAATFGSKGDWTTLDEEGGVQFQQADRRATSQHAHIDRLTDVLAMDGAPVLSDAMSRSTVSSVRIHQKSGEIEAAGPVISTYLPTAKGTSMNLGAGAAHVTGDSLSGSTASGHMIYQGHARLWQGDSVMQADRIEVWRDEKKLQASGHVIANFAQASSAGGGPFAPAAKATAIASSAPAGTAVGGAKKQPTGPTLWEIRAPLLTYWDDLGKAHLEGGVTATSDQGSMESQTLDAFLDKAPPKATAQSSAAPKAPGAPSGQLSRAVAQGGVVVRQGALRATSERADYTAADGKFVLSGGFPTIVDASGDTTTGHSLTFYVASDTILVDSDSSSRALTKHRIEK